MNQFGSGIFYFTGINYLNQLISVSKLRGRSEKLNNRRNNFWMPYLQKDCGSLPVLLKLVCPVIHPPWEKLLLSSNRSISERLFCFRRWMTSLCFHSQKTRSRIPLSSYNKTFSTYLWDPAFKLSHQQNVGEIKVAKKTRLYRTHSFRLENTTLKRMGLARVPWFGNWLGSWDKKLV